MTETIDTAQPEALRLANSLFTAAAGSDAGIYTGTMRAAAVELRRLHAALAAAEARNATLTDDAARKTEQLDKLLAHCPEGECYTCSTIICPHACELHFHHDGCPACAEHDAAASISTKEGADHAKP